MKIRRLPKKFQLAHKMRVFVAVALTGVALMTFPGVASTSGASVGQTANVWFPDYLLKNTPGIHFCDPRPEWGCSDSDWHGGPDPGSDEWVTFRNLGIEDTWAVDSDSPGHIGIIRDNGRCFMNPGESCNSPTTTDAPVQGVPKSMELPVISGSSVADFTPAPGAIVVSSRQGLVFRHQDPSTCDTVFDSPINGLEVRAAVIDSYDFGGDVGVRDNVLITETYHNDDVIGQGHVERYWYDLDYGPNVKYDAWNANQPGDPVLGGSTFNQIMSGDQRWGEGTGTWNCYQGGGNWS